jgi:thioredoxin reductase (NADPH)
MEQIKQFEPGFTLENVLKPTRRRNVYCNFKREEIPCSSYIAGGLGSFEPRKPLIEISNFTKTKESSISSKIQRNSEIKE